MTHPRQQEPLILRGEHAAAELLFMEVEPADPLGAFPSLQIGGYPYGAWLIDEVLRRAVEAWSQGGTAGRAGRARVREVFAAASGAARLAFAQILPAATAAGEPAVLAALGVTTNLQRTLARLAEFMLEDQPALAAEASAKAAQFRLSRRWSGLLDYPPDSPYFPARIRRPAAPGRPRPHRKDPRHLCNALWCSPAAVKARCAEAIDRLGREVRQDRARSGE